MSDVEYTPIVNELYDVLARSQLESPSRETYEALLTLEATNKNFFVYSALATQSLALGLGETLCMSYRLQAARRARRQVADLSRLTLRGRFDPTSSWRLSMWDIGGDVMVAAEDYDAQSALSEQVCEVHRLMDEALFYELAELKSRDEDADEFIRVWDQYLPRAKAVLLSSDARRIAEIASRFREALRHPGFRPWISGRQDALLRDRPESYADDSWLGAQNFSRRGALLTRLEKTLDCWAEEPHPAEPVAHAPALDGARAHSDGEQAGARALLESSGSASAWSTEAVGDSGASVPRASNSASQITAARYGFRAGGLDAFVVWMGNVALTVFTLGLASVLGVTSGRWTAWRITNVTRDGLAFHYRSSFFDGVIHGLVNALLFFGTGGLATPWIVARSAAYEVQHTTTGEGHRMRFVGTGLDVLGHVLLGGLAIVCSFGLAWPFVAVALARWRVGSTCVLDPRAPGGEYRLRFDAGGASYWVQGVLTQLLTLVTLGLYWPFARASYQQFLWASTSDTLSPPVMVRAGPRTPGQWAAAMAAGLGASTLSLGALAVIVSQIAGGPEGVAAYLDPCAEGSAGPACEDTGGWDDEGDEGTGDWVDGADRSARDDGSAASTTSVSVFRDAVEAGRVQRLTPSRALASRHLRSEGRYPPEFAFDGTHDTAWAVRDFASGNDWLEARFEQPVHVGGVRLATGYLKTSPRVGDLFPLNDHLRSGRLETDEGSVLITAARDARSLYIPLGHRTSRVRLVVLDVWRGTRWADLSISEMEVFGSPAIELTTPQMRPLGVPAESVRLPTVAQRASRSHVVGHTHFEPSGAFDGNRETAWLVDEARPGRDWVEGCFDSGDGSEDYEYHVIHGVSVLMGFDKVSSRYGDLFLQNAGVLEANIVAEDGTTLGTVQAAAGQRVASLTFAPEREISVRCIRVVPTRIRPGTRWQQLAISEVEIWGSPEPLVE